MTRRAILNHCITDNVTKHVQLLLQQTFDQGFCHPHPFNGIVRSELSRLPSLDAALFDPKFLFPLLLVSRWFLKTCMRDESHVSNNNAHLVLYGTSGTGKTLIVSVISSIITTYKYLIGAGYQNPDILQSSLISLEEFPTSLLPSNEYKCLLDIKTHVKINFKNLHPENVTEGVPCMITTNDDIFHVLNT